MKIRSNSDVADLAKARELAQQDQTRAKAGTDLTAGQLAKKLKAESDASSVEILGGGDRVSLGLSRTISSELNPESMAAERRKRVEELKLLVAQGKYNPSSEAVARSVGEEIMLEIMSAGSSLAESN